MAGENSAYDGRRFGRQRCASGSLPRHRHEFSYMCVVLGGHFLEAGDSGRFRVAPGDVLIHRTFEGHFDIFDGTGADVLNLPMPRAGIRGGRFRVADPDAIVRIAEDDAAAASAAAAAQWTEAPGESDWPDMLARDLATLRPLRIGEWAARHRLAPATVSRGFRQAYGSTPARFRAELRARHAWARLPAAEGPLVHLALDAGFADQAHMTRSIRRLTGAPPACWRREVKSVQDAG
ncbi:MAG TPA: AraC family transcriptional regulator [Allosphingosinicella sp.]|jgi:AraC-like DNA-binding protein